MLDLGEIVYGHDVTCNEEEFLGHNNQLFNNDFSIDEDFIYFKTVNPETLPSQLSESSPTFPVNDANVFLEAGEDTPVPSPPFKYLPQPQSPSSTGDKTQATTRIKPGWERDEAATSSKNSISELTGSEILKGCT
ncbi:hypothetical protein CROQUDRAFT_96766 [Cronartium quercuum f. sp. fusiforme G11]|uniref:Uncharacterized protein n=1 Tax=Cronartium quercuum f. sp. fusiforme G11 TaxID=708437 RepID=A0A9P6T900_9BASI|nr:hypothetical protein CROQUDRAFT_96766 [Cronartium quercuum f. sp. fusiforme G11]